MTFQRYTASVGDTDLLVNVAKSKHINIMENLFDRLIIPKYISDIEMLKIGKDERFFLIKYKRLNPNSPIEFMDREQEGKVFNKIASNERSRMLEVVGGKGECECCGYARALDTRIVISDNKIDYPDMEKEGYILLGHKELITLNIYFGLLTPTQGEQIYNDINLSLTNPNGHNYNEMYKRSMKRFRDKNWCEYLRIAEKDCVST